MRKLQKQLALKYVLKFKINSHQIYCQQSRTRSPRWGGEYRSIWMIKRVIIEQEMKLASTSYEFI